MVKKILIAALHVSWQLLSPSTVQTNGLGPISPTRSYVGIEGFESDG